MHKIYVEFSISGTIIINETEKERVMVEMSKMMSKFLRNKDITDLQNSISSSDEMEIVESLIEAAEA